MVILEDRASCGAWQRLSLLAASIAFSTAHAEAAEVPPESLLPPITVIAPPTLDPTTEGQPGYATRAATVGAKAPTPVKEIPSSVSVITRQRIVDQGLVSVDQALAQVTGVTVTPWDGATNQIRSRGYLLESSLDGIPVYGGLNATKQFDLAMFDRVEVLRGPAGVFKGSGQPSGTANFVRRRGRESFGGSATLSTGRWENHRLEAEIGGPVDEGGSVRTRLVTAGHERRFHYDRASSRKGMVYATLDADVAPDTTVSVYGAHQDDQSSPFAGLPARTDDRFLDVPRSTNPYPGWTRHDTVTTMATVEVDHRWTRDWQLRARASRQTQGWGFRDAYPTTGINAQGTATYAVRGWDSESSRTALDVHVNGSVEVFARRHTVTAGWNRERYVSDTFYGESRSIENIPILDPDRVPEPSIPPFIRRSREETRQSGFYGLLRWAVADATTVVLGARTSDFEVRSRSGAPAAPTPNWSAGAQETGEVTPFAGLIQQLTPTVTAYGSYSEIFLPQTQRDVTGRTLDPRIGHQVEMGFKGEARGGRLQWSVAAYRGQDRNRAFADGSHPGSFIQAGKAQVQGWEAEVSGSPFAGLDLQAGYARVDSRYLEHATLKGATLSPFEPRHAIKLYGRFRVPDSALSIGAGLDVSSGMVGTGAPGVRDQGGYAVVQAQAGYRLSKDATLALSVNNLFDRTYYARVGTANAYNTFGEPRHLTMSLRTSF
jgi:outer membrane receptor for ferric coprogen and ferric-rhodotorulic acid